jgi:peptidoglycan/LPS O-acetylase OafA/YrhL
MAYHLGPFAGGYLGVDVFFVLSGFLITSLLIGEWESRGGRVSFRDFYARRVLRIFPALGCVIVASVLLAVLMELPGWMSNRPFAQRTLDGLPWVVIFAGNWARAVGHAGLGLLGHTWSLAVEEQFYLLWPALFVLLMRRRFRGRRLAFWLALIAVAEMIYRAVAAHAAYNGNRIYYATTTHSDGLLIGCALAFWLATRQPSQWSPLAGKLFKGMTWLGTTVLAALFFVGSRAGAPLEISGAVLASGLLVAGVVTRESPAKLEGFLSSWPMVRIGRRSYGLYLWNYIVFGTFLTLYAHYASHYPAERMMGIRIGSGAVFIGTFILAELSYNFVELPALRLKRRFRGKAVNIRPLRGEMADIR